jgi:hypothetical protein
MLRSAKHSHGLIDAHLRESYGPDVDSLYYYLVNMKRLAVRLNELRLSQAVRHARERVLAAVSEYTDADRRPIIDEPRRLFRALPEPVLRRIGRSRV